MAILKTPSDVQSIIWRHLNLQDISRLRQTCSSLATAISNDKLLWTHIFNREVKSKSLRIPSNLRDIDEVDAADIESWVHHAVLLDRRYRTPDMALWIRKVCVRESLHITWLKVFLGRWCLVGASNLDESELSLWEISTSGGIQCSAKIFLDGPIVDGLLDLSGGEVNIAVTIGTTRPYILVLRAYHSETRAFIGELGHLSDVAHVQYFRDDLVGFAAYHGDDTHPYISKWKTGEMFRLRIPHTRVTDIDPPFPTEPCKAVTMCKGFVFTLHYTAIHVFDVSGIDKDLKSCSPRHVVSLSLQNPAIDGQFLDVKSVGPCEMEKQTVIHVLYQDAVSRLHQATVLVDSAVTSREAVHIEAPPIKQPPNVLNFRSFHFYQTGLSGRTLFCATSLKERHWRTPSLLFATMSYQAPASSVPYLQVVGNYVSVSKENLPLLHLLSCVDFDDEHGLLLMGTVLGDVRLGSVLSRSIIKPRSQRISLSSTFVLNHRSERISRLPLIPDLPTFYTIRKSYDIHDILPREIVEPIVSQWKDPRFDTIALSGWSDDWVRNEYIWDWIAPLPRWGPLDDYFDYLVESPVSIRIRNRLQSLGDITPIAYRASNHREVLLRIGNSVFYCRTVRGADDDIVDDDLDIAEDFEEGILCALPDSYDAFLNDPMSILPALWNFDILRNMESRKWSEALFYRRCTLYVFQRIYQHQQRTLGTQIKVSDMESWTNDDWDQHFRAATGIIYGPFEEPPPVP